MSILLEFTVDADAFRLGQVLTPPPGMTLELERTVPSGSMSHPFVWAIGDDLDTFEETVRSHEAIKALTLVDRFEEHGLYRVEWDEGPTDLLAEIEHSGAAVLEARGDETWEFRVRFPNHETLSSFHDAVRDRNIPIRIERWYTPMEPPDQRQPLDLTSPQREALVAALKRGYFATPREVQLDELADEFGITRQAMSNRLRRGNELILRSVLLCPESEDY